ARVGRDDSTLTLFVNPPSAGCQTWFTPDAHVSEELDAVVITVTATARPADCSEAWATQLKVGLSFPLSGRPLKDGSNGATVRTYFDADLPEVPAGCSEIHTTYFSVDRTHWNLGFNCPGSELLFRITGDHVSGTPTVPLGSRKGEIYAVGQTSYGVRWQVG